MWGGLLCVPVTAALLLPGGSGRPRADRRGVKRCGVKRCGVKRCGVLGCRRVVYLRWVGSCHVARPWSPPGWTRTK
jgi:hypothetical protein